MKKQENDHILVDIQNPKLNITQYDYNNSLDYILKQTHITALESSIKRQERIVYYGKKLVSSLEYEKVINIGAHAFMKITNCDKLDIGFVDEHKQFHCHEKSRNNKNRFKISKLVFDEYDLLSSHTLVENLMPENEYRKNDNIYVTSDVECCYNDNKSVAIIKLKNESTAFGRIVLIKDGFQIFKKSELVDVKSITDYLSIALTNCKNANTISRNTDNIKENQIQLIEMQKNEYNDKNQLLKLSFTDKLTQVYNRRYYEESLHELDQEEYLPLGIIVTDINSLKVLNDAFGHHYGDLLIKETARVLNECCSNYGTVSRIGGDEFSILIPNVESEIMKDINIKIENAMKSIDSLPVKATISIGSAIKFSKEEDIQDVISSAENIMYKQKLLESKKMKGIIIKSLKDKINDNASQDKIGVYRLKNLALKMSEALSFDRELSLKLEMLVDVHNIGEFGISNEIFNKKEKLSLKEKDIIKSHVKRGYHITNASYELNKISEEILSHHERWDGRGYPRSLKGEEIPEVARAFTIIDSYNAMLSCRPHRDAISSSDAVLELVNNSGSQFDGKMVEIFIKCVLNENLEN